MSDERERRFRSGLAGRERPLDWQELAELYGVDEPDARELHEEAMRRTGDREESRRRRRQIYIELLERALREKPHRPPPGKVTRSMALRAASGGRRSSRAAPPAPGKVSLTSYLPSDRPSVARATGEDGEESRAQAAARMFDACLAVGRGTAHRLEARDRQLLRDELGIDVDSLERDGDGPRDRASGAEQPEPPAARFLGHFIPSLDEGRAGGGREVPAEAAGRRTPLIVDDVAVAGPGQMHKGEFLAQLRPRVTAAATEVLGPERSAADCPYLEHYFAYYAARDAGQLEQAIRKFAPEAGTRGSAGEYVAAVVTRVRRGVQQWRSSGRLPADAAAVAPPALAAAAAAEASGGEDLRARLGDGAPLDPGAAARIGGAYGADFADVRVHADAAAERIAAEQGALAVTVGSDILFAAGEYRPGTWEGDALLAHELAHVVQQRGGSRPGAGAQPGEAHEADADSAAVGVIARLYGGARDQLSRIAANAGPALRSAVAPQRCQGRKPAMSAKEADRYVAATPLIRELVKHNVEKGFRAEGRTFFHDQEAFREAWWRSSTFGTEGRNLSEEARRKAREKADETADGLAGFRDAVTKEIHIRRDKAGQDTTIHELMHLHMHEDFDNLLGKVGDEGGAHYFTKVICDQHGLDFSASVYEAERQTFEVLVAEVGQQRMARAFFSGATQPIVDAIEAKGRGSMQKLTKLIDDENYEGAKALIRGAGKALEAQEGAEEARERAENARQKAEFDEQRRRRIEAERKSWPEERRSPVKARIAAIRVDGAKVHIRFDRGGADGIREGWTGTLLSKEGGKPIDGGSFTISHVDSREAAALVDAPHEAVMKASREVTLSPAPEHR